MCEIPGSGRSSGQGNGKPLQCSCLENPMGGGAWWATIYGAARWSDMALRLNNDDIDNKSNKVCQVKKRKCFHIWARVCMCVGDTIN